MKKDIEIPEVHGVYIAAVHEANDRDEMVWNVYFINDKPTMIEGVLITSKGYELADNKVHIRTAQMRHVVGNVPAKSGAFVELIDPQVFGLFNDFWVTFFEDGRLMERKFTFGPDTIDAQFAESLPILEKSGILVS